MRRKKIKIIGLFIISALITLISCNSSNKVYYKGESKNLKNCKFYNSFEEQTTFSPKGKDFLKWLLFKEDRVKWKEEDITQFATFSKYEKKERTDGLEVVFVNHSTFLIQIEGINILTDPIWSDYASPVFFAGPKRFVSPPFKMEELPKIDYILLSHSHYDHLDIPTLKQLNKLFNPQIITGLGICTILKAHGLINCIERDWGQSVKTKERVEIFYEKAKHWSKRGLFDANKTLWGSFVVKSPNFKVFFAGDTGMGKHFKMIGEEYGGFDVSLLPVGGYKPRNLMEQAHINPEEAVLAHKDLKSKLSIGMHLKTFQLTDEGYNAPVEDLNLAKNQHKIKESDFIVLNFGERKEIVKNSL